ncbi:MAG: methyltransferase domain-containing protein [Anaerolineales bacterium]|nr:methyltransferase domain-containing protein [Anaerolineales bacterium]
MTRFPEALNKALEAVYSRSGRPIPWESGGNLPWNDADFSRRMLREHLDESHGAASRDSFERSLQIEWFWEKLGLCRGSRILDVTCGPGLYAIELARRGCSVVGVDFGPAAIGHARDLAVRCDVADHCIFVEQDVREADFSESAFDAALFIYGQLGVFRRNEAQQLLEKVSRALVPGGKLCVELLDQAKVDKQDSSWWFTDDKGLWGDEPFLHLGERFWYPEEELSLERFQIIYLESGRRVEIQLCDQTYCVETIRHMMNRAGFVKVDHYPAWDGLPLYDADEWIVYVAKKGSISEPVTSG